jgi:Zn finger protein HypA/HybF involved in hydrogenase expression
MRFRNLDRYRTGGTGSRMQLSIPIPRTPDGRAYRHSPNENAHPRHFVLGKAERPESITEEMRARMKLEPGSPQTVCPYSGTVADDDEFTHPADREAAIELVKHAAFADVSEQLSSMFKSLGRGQSRNSMVRFEVKETGRKTPKPRFHRVDLLRELACDHCGRDYGVYAIGLFCPDCGAPNLRLHFAREVDLVDAQVELADGLDGEGQELAYRLLGNAHEDVLTAFEATLKTVYLFGHAAARPGEDAGWVGNDFQNVARGRKRFAVLDCDPFAVLDDDELASMKLNIQKRHVIGHNLGVVDARFAEESGEAGLGETLRLVGDDIRSFAAIAQKVVDALDAWIGGVGLPVRERAELEEDEAMPARAANELGLNDLAYRVGAWLAERSTDGLEDHVTGSALAENFEGVPTQELIDAVAELEVDGYVSTRSFGEGLPHIVCRVDLFSAFDPPMRGTNPTADAAALGRIALEMGETVDVGELHGRSRWDRRRFNPALSILVGHIDDRRVSRTGDHEYPTRFFMLVPADRVAIRRFAEKWPA